ncbi:DUF2069 domain-containing protein [Mycetohabitans sp. B8]|uniref:DUF2069 domain-containing protein n=1 Tax=Mycetohabitans sp. B8 TaxID=2841845 RepID=UPI001F30E78A|nr:DUF2069 domain-containing protein [Mycetohabitans sp. B8]MCG1042012.1 DUF2069 domain-containing protein [Mycetohabitans sp. B8]
MNQQPSNLALRTAQRLHRLLMIAIATLLALVVLAVNWEIWLAPLHPGGSALALKALPLLLVVPGLLRARLYTMQWSAMLILAYFAEGIVRAISDAGASARLGWIEAVLALVYFVSVLGYLAPFKRTARHATAASDASAEHR